MPSVHSNGTNAQNLRSGYEAAADAVRSAIEWTQAVEFNARDYYVQGPGAWDAALAERSANLQKLADVLEHLEAHIIAIDEQAPNR